MEENRSRWQELYRSALLELDKDKLAVAIQAAQQAVHARLQNLQNNAPKDEKEVQALTDALHTLAVLSQELDK
jgi:hypothetical protein